MPSDPAQPAVTSAAVTPHDPAQVRPALPAVGPLGFPDQPLRRLRRRYVEARGIVHVDPACPLLADVKFGRVRRGAAGDPAVDELELSVGAVLAGDATGRHGQPLRRCPCVLDLDDTESRPGGGDPAGAYLAAGLRLAAVRTLIEAAADTLTDPDADPAQALCELLLAQPLAAAVTGRAGDCPTEIATSAAAHRDTAAALRAWALWLPHVAAARAAFHTAAAVRTTRPDSRSWELSGLARAGETAARAAADFTGPLDYETSRGVQHGLTILYQHPDATPGELARHYAWADGPGRDLAPGVATHAGLAAQLTAELAAQLTAELPPAVYLVEDWRATLTGTGPAAAGDRADLTALFGLHPVHQIPGSTAAAVLLPEPVWALLSTQQVRGCELGPVPDRADWAAAAEVALALWLEHGGTFRPEGSWLGRTEPKDPLSHPAAAYAAAVGLLTAGVAAPTGGPDHPDGR